MNRARTHAVRANDNVLSPRGTPVLIMFGARGVTTTPSRGRFHCPHCGVPRAYIHRRVRRFLVLFFVPLVPLRGEREFVQCGFCRFAVTNGPC